MCFLFLAQISVIEQTQSFKLSKFYFHMDNTETLSLYNEILCVYVQKSTFFTPVSKSSAFTLCVICLGFILPSFWTFGSLIWYSNDDFNSSCLICLSDDILVSLLLWKVAFSHVQCRFYFLLCGHRWSSSPVWGSEGHKEKMCM